MRTTTDQKKVFYDSNRQKHILSVLIADAPNTQLWTTAEGYYVRFIDKIQTTAEIEERLGWLSDTANKLHEFKPLVFPTGVLINCDAGEHGYVLKSTKETTLQSLIQKPSTEKLYRWYFDLTGGISYRLKLGYQLAKLLIKLHRAGILINTLSPDLIFVDSYKAESPITNIEIAVTENVSTYSRKPLYAVLGEYADPMIGRKMTVQTTYSDTYAFAVTLFSLLTLCHPFKGEQHENLPREKHYEFILTGSLDYIGDPEGENYSDLYEDNQVFLSSELKALFLRTFKDGKFDHTLRPSLQEYADACLKSINHLTKCDSDNCGKEYNDDLSHICPFCMQRTRSVVYVSCIETISQSKRVLMPMDLQSQELPLPLVENAIATMSLQDGINYIPRSFLSEDVPVENERRSLAIYVSHKTDTIYVYNMFKQAKVVVNNQLLDPYVKTKNNRLQFRLGTDEIRISLPNNMSILTERSAVENSKEYGRINIQKFLVVKRG